ncbi:hypothetical protein [Mucilaginibacter sp. BT774]|uniref:hypothetical protein n=1 Tax=Mucilaginibacter sp. BT774 TaxID=3062276 RepID=UPI00267595E8|nr:hypothetical protein [Mucilaginibacter sp. BT774]MDO3624764.1 hypothetical protein [Mucilaginibacter sp. BT774]
MNTEKEDKLDGLFKKGLEDPVNEAAFRDADWDAMEQMLDKSNKRSAIVFWLPIAGSIAAMLLIFLGYLFFKTNETKPEKKDQIAVKHPVKREAIDKAKGNTGTSGELTRQAADSGKQQTQSAQYATTTSAKKSRAESGKTFFPLSSGKGRRSTGNQSLNTNNQQPVLAENIANNKADKKISSDIPDNKTPSSAADGKTGQKADVLANKGKPADKGDKTALGTADDQSNQKVDALANNGNNAAKADDKTALGNADAKADAGQKAIAANTTTKTIKRQTLGSRPVFAFSVLASSDLNGVNSSFQQTKVGGNFGAMFSATFKKWTISTGAQYDIKPYLTNFNNYHTSYKFTTNPSSVNANCRMLDIPLNVNYQVYHQRANSITIGTGLSSYFMLREDYQFNYGSSTTDNYGYGSSNNAGPLHYTVINKNKNILSVLNIDATYTHQINSKFGITVQPYTKVPLSDVGASQVRLQSTGVAVGINWNINTPSKPK